MGGAESPQIRAVEEKSVPWIWARETDAKVRGGQEEMSLSSNH